WQSCHKVTRFSCWLGADNDPVAVQDWGILHGFTNYVEHVELALAYDVIGQWVVRVYVFFRGNRWASDVTSHHGDVPHARGGSWQGIFNYGLCSRLAAWLRFIIHSKLAKVDSARLIGVTAQEALLFELVELVSNRRS